MDKSINENADVLQETREKIFDKYYDKVSEVFCKLDMWGYHDGLAPLEAWAGIAQACADASGYNVTLTAEICKPEVGSTTLRSVGKREVASAEPLLWIAQPPVEQAEADKLVEEYVQKQIKAASKQKHMRAAGRLQQMKPASN